MEWPKLRFRPSPPCLHRFSVYQGHVTAHIRRQFATTFPRVISFPSVRVIHSLVFIELWLCNEMKKKKKGLTFSIATKTKPKKKNHQPTLAFKFDKQLLDHFSFFSEAILSYSTLAVLP